MRGIGRGGRSFKPPQNQRRGIDLADVIENLPGFSELTDAPKLEPINDEWSISDPFEPVDPRDCAKYPASPYCEGDLFRIGPPVGFAVDIKINGCTICVYIYPVVGWMRLTPTIICRRDPNCAEDNPPPPPKRYFDPPPRLEENVQPDRYKSPNCAFRESMINRNLNIRNAQAELYLKQATGDIKLSDFAMLERRNVEVINESYTRKITSNLYTQEQIDSGCVPDLGDREYVIDDQGSAVLGEFVNYNFGDTKTSTVFLVFGEQRLVSKDPVTGRINFIDNWDRYFRNTSFAAWQPASCCGMPNRPPFIAPPPLPPPFGRDDDRKRGGNGKKGGKDMCCNDCRDSKDNTDKLLKEIKAIKKALGTGQLEKALDAAVGIGDSSVTTIVNLLAKRIGVNDYPIEVPASLLSDDNDDKTYKLQSNAEYLFWLTTQIDKLVGEFPIDIEVKDADPIKAGEQPMKIRIPNIAEAIAEIYGLAFKSSVNQEVELNMLLRLALETTHAKNAAIIAQDYARGNAKFLGYQGNTKGRHVDYNFDFTDVNASQKDQNKQLNLESLLKNSKAWIQGWENDDSETAVNFLRKLMFSAGIIKSVFFRDKKQSKAVVENIKAMQKQAKAQDDDWVQFLKDINDPNSKYNVGSTEKPDINEDKSK